MNHFVQSFVEIVNGQACAPHPGDGALSLRRRFATRTFVVIGGGGTGTGWTQRVSFDRQGAPDFSQPRSGTLKRATPEWRGHLSQEARSTGGWAVILIEQQWQASATAVSAASLGVSGVEQMLRVRDAVADFGDNRLSDDAVRVAIDHPTMEGGIVAGVRSAIVDSLEQEAESCGFHVAAVRIAVISLLERYLARLQKQRLSPDRPIVLFDGQSALIVGIKDSAFDQTEGGVSYLVNRSATDARTQLEKRITALHGTRDWNDRIVFIGSPLSEAPTFSVDKSKSEGDREDALAAAIDDLVFHDLRSGLQEMRLALSLSLRRAVFGSLALTTLFVVISALQGWVSLRMEERISAQRLEAFRYRSAIVAAAGKLDEMKREESAIRQTAEWVEKNYHAQDLVQEFLNALPADVALDGISIQATEGLAQAKLKFTLFGSEEVQRSSLRAIEARLYRLGYGIGRREDPLSANGRRGGVIYAWDLILPTFGARA